MPAKNTALLITFDLVTTGGVADTTGTPTTTVSKDGGAFAATTNAPVRIGSTNVLSLALTATEMNADLVTVQAIATGDVPRTLVILTTPAAGVKVDLTEALDTTSTGDTIGGALVAARAQAFGKRVITGAPGEAGSTQKFYAADGTTLLHTADLSTAGSSA